MRLVPGRTSSTFSFCYDVLMKYAGATEGMRTDFIWQCSIWNSTDPYRSHEFRFCGKLAGGGKFWLTPESFHVTCYSEDSTEPRQAIIAQVNEELKKLFKAPEVDEEEASCPTAT